MTRTLLFVCEFNSCRSQLAEAIVKPLVPAGWRVISAGLCRTGLCTEVVVALDEISIDARSQTSKSLDDVLHEQVNDVFVLAEPAVASVRTMFPDARVWEWTMDDPMRVEGGSERVLAAVRRARDDLGARFVRWLADQSRTI